MASKFDWKVSKPSPLKDRVRYCCGGPIGIWKVRPMIYKGHKSKSFSDCQSNFGVTGCRLCMVPLDGSSLMTLFTMISSSRSVNQPLLPRAQFAVWHGPGGMRNIADTPTRNVRRPCVLSTSRSTPMRTAEN